MNSQKRLFKVLPTVAELNANYVTNMIAYLAIEFTAVEDGKLTARMPVDERTRQTFGILHGGASVTLAETVGSVAANLCLEPGQFAVGLDINANHIRPIRSGYVYATTIPYHVGQKTSVWDIRLTDEAGRLICVSRLTMAVVQHV